MADKHAQINRYLEIFSASGEGLRLAGATSTANSTIADMGCGKGYLTFGLWHLFARVWKRPAG